jgi:hypothetical protein
MIAEGEVAIPVGSEIMTAIPETDYDSPWKEALERYFEAFMAFFW